LVAKLTEFIDSFLTFIFAKAGGGMNHQQLGRTALLIGKSSVSYSGYLGFKYRSGDRAWLLIPRLSSVPPGKRRDINLKLRLGRLFPHS
jgi:hypothetical protein